MKCFLFFLCHQKVYFFFRWFQRFTIVLWSLTLIFVVMAYFRSQNQQKSIKLQKWLIILFSTFHGYWFSLKNNSSKIFNKNTNNLVVLVLLVTYYEYIWIYDNDNDIYEYVYDLANVSAVSKLIWTSILTWIILVLSRTLYSWVIHALWWNESNLGLIFNAF